MDDLIDSIILTALEEQELGAHFVDTEKSSEDGVLVAVCGRLTKIEDPDAYLWCWNPHAYLHHRGACVECRAIAQGMLVIKHAKGE